MQQPHIRSTVLHRGIARALYSGVLATALCLSVPTTAWAQSGEPIIQFDIPAQPMSTALKAFADQAGIQMLYRTEVASNLVARPVKGNLEKRQALEQLLEGTGLEAVYSADDAVTIRPASAEQPSEVGKKSAAQTGVTASSEVESEVAGGGSSSARDRSAEKTLDTITVTGTRIRGGVNASPTITIGERQFKQEGFTDLGEVIRSLPQNFRGGQNPGVQAGAAVGDPTNNNISGGSALNLRGLGPGATLTLLNGRRLSYSGPNQAVDISAIPIEAVERIEIVPDGASAIYGSDAVGGVANVILKRDFDGVTLSTLYGDSADGGLKRHDYNVTAGATWNSGGLIATYMKSDQDPIFADQRDYAASMADPSTLYNGSDLSSGLVSAHHQLGDRAELRVDALRTVRERISYQAYPTYYNFGHAETTVKSFAPSIALSLSGDWTTTLGASHGTDKSIADTTRVAFNSGVRNLTANLCYCNETEAWELGAEGPLFSLGGRDMRLAIGLGTRRDDFAYKNLISGSVQGGERRNRYAYGELAIPVVDAGNARLGVQRLEFSIALRAEDYDGFGRVNTPKLGAIYDPNTDFTLKASWGRSFKTPTLIQMYASRGTELWSARQLGCSSCAATDQVLRSYGGDPDLDPERARTWTASVAFHPDSIPGLDAELTYFSIDYEQRVVNPTPSIATILSNPDYAQFVQYGPAVSQQEELIATYNDDFYNGMGAAYDPSKVIAIVSGHNVNVARQQAKGLDLSGSYSQEFSSGRLTYQAGASWLDLSQQSTPQAAAIDLSGMLYFPAKLNARLGTIWSQGGLSLSAFATYVSGVTNKTTSASEKTASFTTFDTTLRYETVPGVSPLAGLALSLSVDNVFNRPPPLFTQANPRFVPYDSTNYSAIGRYITVSVSKGW